MNLPEELRRLFSHFVALFNLRISLVSPLGEEVALGSGQERFEYCRLLDEELSLGATCAGVYKRRFQEAAERGNPVEFTCPGGLHQLILPLSSRGTTVGFLAIRDSRQVTGIPPAVLHKWNKLSGDGRLKEAFLTMPYFRSSEMHHIKGLLMILADLIVSRDMLVPQAEDPLDSLIAHMRQNVEKTLSLDDAARFVNKSKSRLSHMFTERLGKSFKQVQTEIRMEWAERLLVKQVSTSIQDIALMIGFQDPLYFTKYFKRYKGLSPTEFRESLERAQQPSPAPDAGPKAEA